MISIWVIIAGMAKLAFNAYKPIANLIPDSSLLIVLGLVLGGILSIPAGKLNLTLDSHVFFVYLLPPVIFDAGYFMPNRAFFKNIDSILLFAVVGIIFNTMAIGASLWFLSYFDIFTMEFSVFEIFVFSALISACDPVAVIAFFEEIHVNEFLFVNVFGEALFNDAVTVVLYQMLQAFIIVGAENVQPADYGTAVISFFAVSFGGCAIGIIFGLVTVLVTKYTSSVRILAPLFVFVLPYMAYLTAEMTSLSSIIAIAVCGMVMKQYVKENITTSAAESVKQFTKMLAQSSETVIFMFLGLSTISYAHYWDTWFVVATVVCCLLWRTIGVVAQCWILNKFRHKNFTMVDQIVLSYGGLRGAIAFGLAVSMPDSIAAKHMFITTMIAVIFFSVFVQGVTIRPLVRYLKVETIGDRETTMTESVYNKYLDYVMSGLEDLTGQKGHYSFRDAFERFNAKILRPVLLKNKQKSDFDASTIVRAYAKMTLEDAVNMTSYQKSLENTKINSVASLDSRDSANTFHASGYNIDSLNSLISETVDREMRKIDEMIQVPMDESRMTT